MPTDAGKSIYERIGGEAAVMAAVDLFYQKVLSDPRTKPFFDGLDMQVQVKKQIAFMMWALGGPAEYKGRDLGEAHAKLRAKGLNDSHFDAVVEHLRATLRELKVPEDLIAEALGVVGTTRDKVMGR
jgi:hemoglobin